MTDALFSHFKSQLQRFLTPNEMITSYSKRYAYGTDASFYRLVPKLILALKNKDQVQHVLILANKYNVPLTFRAAGTSLSGQAITDSVLITLTSDWQQADISNSGNKIRLQPGIIGAKANQLLLPYNKKIGPDPASIDSCKIGGIAANNASGMCCGVKQNSYHTLADMTIIFADGTELNTSDKNSCHSFIINKPELINTINQLLNTVKDNTQLSALIRNKYRYKNTCGYGINSLLDFEHPIDVIKHLMIGSEGTLGFIADITFNTVDDYHNKVTGFYIFDDVTLACNLVSQLAKLEIAAIELLDVRSLRSVADRALLQTCLQKNKISHLHENAAALLIEIHAPDSNALDQIQQKAQVLMSQFNSSIIAQVEFTKDHLICSELWQIRKATFPAVGAVRKTGTTVVIEDVTFPTEHLGSGVQALQGLFKKYQYDEAIIFGHALDGNLHFVFTQSFNEQKQIDRYSKFMQDVSHLVAIQFKGSLKAEHGTGRNMAPFVALEWGSDAYQLMQQIKHAFDPNNILNPDVLISDNANIHLENLKTLPTTDNIIDKCIECGFCESVCPSNGFTLTPRQRISVWRRIIELENILAIEPNNNSIKRELDNLKQDYQYLAIDTCAATGLCGLKCPVGINTGEFIKSLRAEKLSTNRLAKHLSKFTADHLNLAVSTSKLGLSAISIANKLASELAIKNSFKLLNKISGKRIPLYYPAWPKGAKAITKTKQQFSSNSIKQVIYIPSCGGRTFAQDKNAEDQRALFEVVSSIFKKAGFEILIPKNINDLCCGMPWASKGDQNTANNTAHALISSIYPLTNNGKTPIIMDASPCTLALDNYSFDNMPIKTFEVTDFIDKFILKHLKITPQLAPITLHISCSSKRQNIEHSIINLAQACANEVLIPSDINCCGFAGDKGFFLPQLNENALRPLEPQLKQCKTGKITEGYSNSRTCEIGLTKATNIPYQSIVYLLDRVSSTFDNY
ncbi:FAD-binding and (Fe-S)-binding domain-containing protein [Pseudoalteromonas denitrificans]|uniref:D-lactate dehydrogenase (cytochrome) n=1 Tax=Pseudoalteromonas denitrificans DSM 6059 TaxID=1123010 RepID=A0A1I1LHP0_9GAMM|nr:FAD-binding and (Fe-S)-binding domain-containing protein [Pseudoalteromonas denitrificans]SFC72042.1 D-lactate dehydrogenase [Pseudoalteromonas denitrificans DSM 6059]